MNSVGPKIYYLISTGKVLFITTEMLGDVIATSKEEDIKIYEPLKDKLIDEIDYIELEYGTLATTFDNVKSYKVNVETKQLEMTYYSEEELEAMQKQNQEVQELNDRVSTISEYLQNQTSSISDVENYILESEKNKLL